MELNRIKIILAQLYEIKMISKDNNHPTINIERENLKDVCVLLHNGVSINSIKEYYNWTQEELLKRFKVLLSEELILETDKGYKPNLMIISLEDYKYINKSIDNILSNIVNLIEHNIHLIKNKTLKLDCFKNFDFENLSMFILSGVILDFIQIDNVEELLLKKDRTKHGKKHYYYSMLEKIKYDNKEAFGIYGNQVATYGDNMFGIYGNERDRINFINIDIHYINKHFTNLFNDYKEVDSIKAYLLNELIKYYKESSYNINNSILCGFNSLGIMTGNKINIPIITETEFIELSKIADIIKKEYIDILQKYKTTLLNDYKASVYSNEITFEEYFIWWYHILYSRVTDVLVQEHKIVVPEYINFSYLVINK